MKHKLLSLVEKEFYKNIEGDFNAGDTVKIHYRIREGEKERIQIFEGIVISRTCNNFTVRKISAGVGIERKIPIHSPSVSKVEVVRRGKVRRAKLYYLRDKYGKAAKVRELHRAKR